MIITFFYLTLIFLCYSSRVESACECGVTFYQHSGYSGKSLKVKAGERYPDLRTIGWNDQISSLRFFNNTDECRCVAYVGWEPNFKNDIFGGSNEYIDDYASLASYSNDKFSAVSVRSFNPSTDAYVMFYKSCAGSYEDYSYFVQVTDTNQFEGVRDLFQDFFEIMTMNDGLSRVVVSEHAAVQLYQDNNYQGDDLLITGPADIGCLTSTSKGNWNDKVTSAKIYDLRKGGFPAPKGYWVLHTSAGSDQALSYTVHRGYSTEETTTSTESFNFQISSSIEAGVEFEGIGSIKTSLSVSTSNSISQMLQNSIVQQSDFTCVETCKKNTCPSGSITYLYSWQMDFQRPWNDAADTTLASCNYICRCDPTPPRCPLTTCNNTDCSICLPY